MDSHVVNLHRLRVFVQVVEARSFSRAAEQLFLTQPAVSMHIRELEDVLGMQLFERTRRLTLTAAGEAFYESARKIIATVEDAESNIKRIGGIITGRVSLGVTPGWQGEVTRMLIAFRLRYPDVFLAATFGIVEDFFPQLFDDRLGLALVSRASEDSRLEVIPVAAREHPLMVLASLDNPIAKRKRIDPSELERLPFIHYEPRKAIQMLEHLKIKPRYVMELESSEAIAMAVAAGLGVTVATKDSVARLHTKIRAIPLAAPPLRLPLLALRGKHRKPSPAEEALLSHILTGAKSIK